MIEWLDVKTAMTETSGLSRDALHIFAGLGVHTLLVLLFRSWFGALWPVGIVLVLALGNEWADLTSEVWPDERARQYGESIKDFATTMAAPLLLLLLSRFAPGSFSRRSTPSPDAPPSE